jgi:hypothetical protein
MINSAKMKRQINYYIRERKAKYRSDCLLMLLPEKEKQQQQQQQKD